MDNDKRDIIVRMRSVDDGARSRRFNNIESARAWAKTWLGEYFDISHTFGYAISGDGVCKITCEGVDIYTLLDRRLEVDDASL
jgi:hypothetical protein